MLKKNFGITRERFKITGNLIHFILNSVILALALNFVSLIYVFFQLTNEKIITLDYGEAFILESVWKLKNGFGIYQNFSTDFSTLTAIYPPLYYYYLLFINKITGLPLNLNLILVSNFLLLAVLTLTIYKIVVLEVRSRKIGVLSALIFFLLFQEIFTKTISKIDILATLLEFYGIYLLILFRNKKIIYLSIIPFILALFTKQTAIIVFLAILPTLFFNANGKKIFLKFAGVLFFISMIIFAIINYKTGGIFYQSVIQTHLIILSSSLKKLLLRGINTIVVLITIAIPVLFFLPNQDQKQQDKKLWLFLFLIIAFFDLTLTGKAGSDLNYLLDLLISADILICILLSDFVALFKNKDFFYLSNLNKKVLLSLILFLILSSRLMYSSLTNITLVFERDTQLKYYSDKQNELDKFFHLNSDKKILSEENMYNFINNKHSDIYEFFVFNNLIKNGNWDEGILLRKLEKEYAYLVLTTNIIDNPEPEKDHNYSERFSENFLTFIKNKFYLYREIKYKSRTIYYIFKNESDGA